MDEAEQRLDSLCSRIIESDRNIRFVGISNKMGNQIISRYRAGLIPLLTQKEIEMYAIQSENQYIRSHYQKLKRVTVSLENKEYPVLLASFDIEADHENIVVNKILPMVNEEGL